MESMESKDGMDEMEALCKKLSFLSSKNQLKWHGSKNDLLRFLTLYLEVQPNQFRANDNGSCAVFKIQNITCNFYHKARTLQIQGKEDADKLRNDLISLTSIGSHPVSETPNALQENQDKDVQLREEISSGLISLSDGSIATCGNTSERNVVKSPVLSTEDDLSKAENFIDNAYMEIILDPNESNYSNPVKDSKAHFDQQLEQLSLLLKGVFNELNNLKVSHAAILAANNEITTELTTLRNDVTSHFQNQSQRLPELNDLKDSHAALLTATSEIANEVINLRNDITSHFQNQSQCSSDTQEWTTVSNKKRPVNTQNRFKALEDSAGEISPDPSHAEICDETSPQLNNANPSTSMSWTDQLAEYRLQHNQKFTSKFAAGISESSTRLPLGQSAVKAHYSSKEVSITADKSTKACLIGDSIVKNIESRKLSRAFREEVKVECSRGAKIKDIHDKANELLACGQLDENTALIVHCGTNDLAVENEDTAATKLRMLITDLKPKAKSLAISAVTLRNDSAAVTAHRINRFNRLTESICEQTNVCFIDNKNVMAHHLNRSNLHLNSSGSKVLGSNFCKYLRRANLPPSGQELATAAAGFRQDHFKVRKPSDRITMWNNYLNQVRRMTSH